MSTFLFGWNPARETPASFARQMRQIERTGFVTMKWRSGGRRDLPLGSRAFMIRLGAEPKGIVGAGWTATEPVDSPPWLRIRFETLRETPIIPIALLEKPPLKGFHWSIQGSGVQLPPAIAHHLETVWASRLETPQLLMDSCVYTIVSRDRLDPVALEGTLFINQESRIWKTASALLEQAEGAGRILPIVFADAKDCTELLYWGLLQKIEIGAGVTKYTVARLRALLGRHATQELVLRSTGEFIAPGFIRPYAICLTPTFLESYVEGPAAPFISPEEGPSEGRLVEGATMQVTVNAYERNAEARARCLAHYGCRCIVCGFDFASHYGDIGVGFIHVHHVVPLSQIGDEYEVDPLRDLRPMCPNCHAMIHRARPHLELEDLKGRLRVPGSAAEPCAAADGAAPRR